MTDLGEIERLEGLRAATRPENARAIRRFTDAVLPSLLADAKALREAVGLLRLMLRRGRWCVICDAQGDRAHDPDCALAAFLAAHKET